MMELFGTKKINPEKIYYNPYGPFDKLFADWRNFYGKFFVDSYEKENKKKEMEKEKKKLEW